MYVWAHRRLPVQILLHGSAHSEAWPVQPKQAQVLVKVLCKTTPFFAQSKVYTFRNLKFGQKMAPLFFFQFFCAKCSTHANWNVGCLTLKVLSNYKIHMEKSLGLQKGLNSTGILRLTVTIQIGTRQNVDRTDLDMVEELAFFTSFYCPVAGNFIMPKTTNCRNWQNLGLIHMSLEMSVIDSKL